MRILTQASILGIILMLAGIGTLIVSIFFVIFSINQLISTRAFDDGFENSLMLLQTDDPTSSDYYKGDHGFHFKQAVFLKENVADDFHSQNSPEDGQIPPSPLAVYLQATHSPLLVKNAIGSEPRLNCIIPRFRDSAIFGLVMSLLQILTSLLYIFWKEKNIPTMSAFFYSYFFIFLTHLVCFCIVLNGKPNRRSAYLAQFGYSRRTADFFAGILGLNCLLLITMTILTCVRCNTEDYTDRCIDQDTCNRKRTDSGALILDTTHASTDRLNK